MWNQFPGAQHHGNHHHNQYGGPPIKPSTSPGFSMPTPGGLSPSPSAYRDGYAPSYAPPPGPPGVGAFAPPPDPPPSGYGPSPGGAFAPPPGPPLIPPRYNGGFSPPPGPPPSAAYGAPPGPPPSAAYGAPSGPPPTNAYSRPGPSPAGGYAPPHGPPPRPPPSMQAYGPAFQGQDSQQHQLQFQYSQCTGRRKALCVGINYIGQSAELKGCINDAQNVKQFLCREYGYNSNDIVMLTDDSLNMRSIPTKQNMLEAMQWLVGGAQPNDSLFFHYSGHGGQTKDLDGDEEDGYDEVIYPVDFQQAGHIVDDLLHNILVKSLPAGCRLTAIFDSCHSGSALDLPYIYNHVGKIKEPNLAAEAAQGLLGAAMSYARGDMSGVFTSVSSLFKSATGNRQATAKTRQTKTSPADVISFSGCKDSQTSADTFEAGRATGAMSYAFIVALSQNKNQSYQQLLLSIREILARKYSQVPQLSSSHPMDTNLLFIC